MRMNAFTNVDVECEVSISAEDVIAELSDRVEKADGERWRVMTEALGLLIQVLRLVKPESIAAIPAPTRALIAQHLAEQSSRYQEPA